jgi:UDP-GlcNAc:undecaprenyl-phosphate GlcNAc-1-phosphate transferase
VTAGQAQAIPLIVAGLCAAAILAFFLSPVAIWVARRAGAIDEPDAGRRVHRSPVPRAGGLAVAGAFIVAGVAAVWADGSTGPIPLGRVGPPELFVLFVGCMLAGVLGFIDDRLQIRARWQLLAQLGLALFVIVFAAPRNYVDGVAVDGIRITFVANPASLLGVGEELLKFADPVSILLTALWIVGMINSLNFIDGLDGLSSGIALIAAVTLGVLSLASAPGQFQPAVALLCAVLAGALAGFLPWNFHPARVFTGTTGVFAVGFALAVLSILGVAKVAVALLVLGVPIIDTFWIIVRRLSHRRSPFTPDRGHFHHRLLDLGLTHRSAVLVIYAICIVLAILSLVLSTAVTIWAFVAIVVGGGLALYLLTWRAQGALDARSYPDDVADGGG